MQENENKRAYYGKDERGRKSAWRIKINLMVGESSSFKAYVYNYKIYKY